MTGYRAITRARKIVFWIAAAIFVFTWPLLISYALGIVISPTSKQPVVETGVVRVDSLPGGARLWLNGTDTGKTTPTAIERLKAGSYHIQLEKQGFRPWRAQVAVDIQAVRRVNSAVLVPDVAKVHLLSVGKYSREYMSPNSQFALFSGATLSDLRVYDLKTGRYLTRSATLAPYLNDKVTGMSLAPWGNLALVHILTDNGRRVLVIHFGPLGFDLAHFVEAPFFQDVDFAWSPTLSGTVYFERGGTLWKMDTWIATSATPLVRNVLSVDILNNILYYIDSQGNFGEVTTFGREHVFFKLPDQARRQLGADPKIEFADEKLGAVLTGEGKLLLFNADRLSVYSGIKGVATDRARDRLIVWSNTRVGSLPLGLAARDAETSRTIDWAPAVSRGSTISSVTPAAGKSNCLFVSGGNVYIEPVLPGVVSPPERVATLAPGESYQYSESSGLLLILDPQIGQIKTSRLVVHPLIPTLE